MTWTYECHVVKLVTLTEKELHYEAEVYDNM